MAMLNNQMVADQVWKGFQKTCKRYGLDLQPILDRQKKVLADLLVLHACKTLWQKRVGSETTQLRVSSSFFLVADIGMYRLQCPNGVVLRK